MTRIDNKKLSLSTSRPISLQDADFHIREVKENSVHCMPGAYIGPDVQIAENVFVGHNAVILSPESETAQKTIIESGVQIGANATILPSLTIGTRAKIMPGSVVTRSVPPLAIVAGNPAHIIGYIDTSKNSTKKYQQHRADVPNSYPSQVQGVTLHILPIVPDLRGCLSVGEFERNIPFKPKRYFLVFDVPTIETRGEHAHLHCHQFLLAVKGSVHILVDDGRIREEFILDKPNMGLYLPPMVWGVQYHYSSDATLLVFASDYYNSDDYIRSYTDFLEKVSQQ